MTTSNFFPSLSAVERLPYGVRLRCGKLFVTLARDGRESHLLSQRDRQFLLSWLLYCPAYQIRVDPELAEHQLKLWAEISQKLGKVTFLRIPPHLGLPKYQHPTLWVIKRLLDWVSAFILLVVISPLLLVIAILIYIDSPGPVLYLQWRVGKRGKLFQIYKFRTMVPNAEHYHYQVMAAQTGLHKRHDDPRITAVGRWLRKYSLDELPQLLNVLKGEMSLVGPRPWALYDAIRICPQQRKRLNALPGMTGEWQIYARGNLLDLYEVTEWDLRYLNRWSLWTDLKILLMTLPKMFSSFGAW